MTLSVLFILLQSGIYIENIALPNLQVKKLYIKWNEKLNISLQEVKIIQSAKKEKVNIDTKLINSFFKKILLFDNWFERIEISKINFNNINGSFKYLEGEDGFLIASSEDFSLKSSLFFESHLFNARIDKFHDFKRNIKIDGNIIFDGYDKIELITVLNININNDVKLKTYAFANKEKLLYRIDSKKRIKSIKHTIEMFNMPKEVKYWAYDAIKTSDIELKSAYGWLDYNKFADAYKNVTVLAIANNLEYTYNPALEPVISKYTELEFKDGTLHIRPKEAYQYGFYLNKSWLKIDFTKKEELLTLYLLFKGKVTKDLLYLLNTYQIKLPFLQHSGSVDTNLKIEVGLRNIDVTARGDFYTKKANFDYLGLNIDIYDAHIFLNNYDVKINNMFAKYQDYASATANVDLDFNAKKNIGKISFRVKDISFKEMGITLNAETEPLNISYNISPKQDFIDIDSSSWKFKNYQVNLDSMIVPFNLDKLTAQIPTTLITIPNMLSAYASGKASLKPNKIDLDVDLLKFSQNDIKLSQSNVPLKILYDNRFIISSNKQIRFSIDNLDYTMDNTLLDIKDSTLNLRHSKLSIDNMMKADIAAKYNLTRKNGQIELKNTEFKNKKVGEIFSNKYTTEVKIQTKNDKTIVKIDELDIEYISTDKGWKLKFNSFKNISKKSKILQEYHLTNGNFTLFKKNSEKNIKIFGEAKYPYKLLVSGNKPVENYVISGEINNKTKDILLFVNSSIKVNISKEIKVYGQDIGINIDELLNFFDDKNTTSKNSETKNIIFNAKNCYLYISKDRHVISDTMDLQYFNNIVTAQLIHKNGNAGFKLDNSNFHLYGKDFNDEFMTNLFALSKFKDGKFSFSMSGTTKEYVGVFHIKETTILEYKVLNNILAFINTIPSLVTFSLPSYTTKGLDVKSAYMYFKAKDDVFNISDISLDSQEVDIVGRGSASFKHNNIDLELSLKTDLGSSVSKIPVVGYILLGKDTVSASLSITGALNDPDVKTLLAKDIVVAPLNIIKRTLLLPFHLFDKEEE